MTPTPTPARPSPLNTGHTPTPPRAPVARDTAAPKPPARPTLGWARLHLFGAAITGRIPASAQRCVLAHYHARNHRAAHAGIASRVHSGQHRGPAPYGYRTRRGRGGRVLVPDAARAQAVREIFIMRVAHGWGPARISRHLGADPQRYPPPPTGRAGGTPAWTRDGVARILANPVYTGAQVWGRTRHGRPVSPSDWITATAAHPALIERWTWHAAQRPLRPAGDDPIRPLYRHLADHGPLGLHDLEPDQANRTAPSALRDLRPQRRCLSSDSRGGDHDGSS